MKKILITLLIASASTAAFAQDSARKHIKRAPIQQDLKLDESQTEKVKAINKDFMTSAKAIQKDDQLTKGEKRAKMAEVSKQRSEKFRTVLNDEQYSKWESNQKATREKMDGMRAKHDRKMADGRGKRPDKSRLDLGLNEEQSKQMKSINSEFRDKAVALRNNKDLSDADRKSQFKQLRDDRDSKVKATLSSEQYEKLRQLGKKQHHPKGAPAPKDAASTNN